MRQIQLAKLEHKVAYLSSEFGMELAKRKIDETSLKEFCKKAGIYSKGKRVGQQRGFIHWTKVYVGGWVVDGYGTGNGHVERPGSHGYYLSLKYDRNSYQ